MSHEPRINVYTCSVCRCNTVTVDVDKGVTPFTIRCRATDGCNGGAYSNFYPRGPKPSWIGEPQWEWYKPTESQLKKMSAAMREHCTKGGLDMRKRTKLPPLFHSDESLADSPAPSPAEEKDDRS